MVKKKSRKFHPLGTQHFQQIIKRSRREREAMHKIWGMCFNLRGRTIAPLTRVALMVQISRPYKDNKDGEIIELLCVHPRIDPQTATVYYDDIRMAHDFSRNPYPGAKGRVLDPRDPAENNIPKGDKPNAEWVRLALELDRARQRYAAQNWLAVGRPEMPKILVGFKTADEIDMVMTEQLRKDSGDNEEKAKEIWPTLWINPNTGNNTTGNYLIPIEYVPNLNRGTVYGDWSDIQGVDGFNITRKITSVQYDNVSRDIASAADVSLDELLTQSKSDDDNERVEAQEMLAVLRDEVASHYSDQGFTVDAEQAYHAVVNPDEPICLPVDVKKNDVIDIMGEAEAVKAARAYLKQQRPHFEIGTTDEDLVNALQKPDLPLYSSKVSMFQKIAVDPDVDPADSFNFKCSERVFVNFWPRSVQRNHEPRRKHVKDSTPKTEQVPTGTAG